MEAMSYPLSLTTTQQEQIKTAFEEYGNREIVIPKFDFSKRKKRKKS